jgi:hypothetical protein
MACDIEEIVTRTEALRSSPKPMWSRIRDLLRERGIEPTMSALIELFPDDVSFQYGVLATADGRVFQFGFDYLRRSEGDGIFTEWRDCSASPPDFCSDADIEAGFKLARGENTAR